MRDVISSHEGSQQMGYGTGLTAVRPEHERVHPPLSGKQNINKHYIMERTHIVRGSNPGLYDSSAERMMSYSWAEASHRCRFHFFFLLFTLNTTGTHRSKKISLEKPKQPF